MASEMDWAYTTCLSCDNQIAEGEFCSQACRLADLEKGCTSEPNSPSSSYGAPSQHYSSRLHLPPAVNFSAYRGSSSSKSYSLPSSPQRSSTHGSASYFVQGSSSASSLPSTSEVAAYNRGLSPSSSRSSLASMTALHPQYLSPQTANYLRGYHSSFDQVRDMKRRATNP